MSDRRLAVPLEISRTVVALETDLSRFPPFVFRLACGHSVAVTRDQIPPDAVTPPTAVRCPMCELLAGRDVQAAALARPALLGVPCPTCAGKGRENCPECDEDHD